MTSGTQPSGTAPSDGQLVAGVLTGDREAFAQVYDRYADRLHDFAYSMLRHREDAADAVADAFVTAAERLEQLRDPERLRPWLYAVVRRECLRRLKARSRTAYGGDEELLELPDRSPAPEELAEQQSLQSLVWDAAGGLNERDRAMLDLHLRQGLDGAELGEAMGMTVDNAYVGLSRLRDQVERSIGALLVARTSRDDCGELTSVLDDWDGDFTPLVRKRVARHVDRCRECSVRRAALASPAALLAGVPAFAAPLLLRDRVLEDPRLVSALASRGEGGGSGSGSGTGPPNRSAGDGPGRRRRARQAAGAGLAVLLALVAVLGWQQRGTDETDLLVEDLGSSVTDTPTGSPIQGPAPSPEPTPTAQATSTPSEPPSVDVSVPPTGTVSAAPTESGATGATAGETDESTPQPAPGRLVATPRALDLGDSGSRTLTVSNTGGTEVTYAVDVGNGWLSAAPGTGTLKPGQSRSVKVTADRAVLPEGSSVGGLTVTWDKGTIPVSVVVSRGAGPVVGVPSTSQVDCDSPLVVTVPISDESGVASARLSWSGPAGANGSTAMNQRGGDWVGTFGPFAVGGTFQLTVTAADTLGNSSTRTVPVDVDPCPQ